MSDLGAVRPPQLMGSVRWKLTEPEMGRSQTMTPPEKNVSEAPGNNSRVFFQALVTKEMSVPHKGSPRLQLTSMGLEKKHRQTNKLQGLLFPLGFKGFLRAVFPPGLGKHMHLNNLKLGLDYIHLREEAAQRSR